MPSLTFAQNMKNAIVANLEALVNSDVLQSYLVDDGSKQSLFDRDFPSFPCAVVTAPDVSTSDYEDQANNLREYTWLILVVTTVENMPASDPTYLEYLIDSVLGQFDGDVTLQGMANGGVLAATLAPPGPVSSNNVTYVSCFITIKARQLVPAGVQ